MRRFLTVVCLCFVLLLLVSCGQDGSGGDFSGISMQQENGTESMGKTVHLKLTGSFAATVREVIPDYCLDDVTPTVAVVTCFQDAPFTLYVGEEKASQLTVGEQYVFEIEETDIGEMPLDMPERYPASPETVIPMFHVKIAEIRPAKEEEWGIDAIHLAYVESD